MTPLYLDTETTSLLARHSAPYSLDTEPRIVSLSVVTASGEVVGSQRINPGVPIPPAATRVHGIRDEDVARSPTFAETWPRILARVGAEALVVAHNAPYDRAVLACELLRAGLPLPPWSWGCTLAAARRILPAAPRHTLDALGAVLGLPTRPDHSSLSDARAAAELGAELTARDAAWLDAVDAWHPLPDVPTTAVTGHRAITEADADEVRRVIRAEPAGVWIFGGALGVDTVALRAAREAGLSWLEVIVPGTVAQQPAEARRAIEECSDAVTEMRAPNLADARSYYARDREMVRRASRVLAFLDGRSGSSGTRATAEYAREQGRQVQVVAMEGRR
jgi:DNA polymerase III epsilon subunit-like protein